MNAARYEELSLQSVSGGFDEVPWAVEHHLEGANCIRVCIRQQWHGHNVPGMHYDVPALLSCSTLHGRCQSIVIVVSSAAPSVDPTTPLPNSRCLLKFSGGSRSSGSLQSLSAEYDLSGLHGSEGSLAMAVAAKHEYVHCTARSNRFHQSGACLPHCSVVHIIAARCPLGWVSTDT